MRYLVFTTNSARIVADPPQAKEMLSWPNVIANPDLTRVDGVLPQFWKLEDELVIPMNGMEIRYRKKLIERNGIDNAIRRLSSDETRIELKDYQVIRSLDKEAVMYKRFSAVIIAIQIIVLIVVLLKR